MTTTQKQAKEQELEYYEQLFSDGVDAVTGDRLHDWINQHVSLVPDLDNIRARTNKPLPLDAEQVDLNRMTESTGSAESTEPTESVKSAETTDKVESVEQTEKTDAAVAAALRANESNNCNIGMRRPSRPRSSAVNSPPADLDSLPRVERGITMTHRSSFYLETDL